jgi:hypothetical protein
LNGWQCYILIYGNHLAWPLVVGALHPYMFSALHINYHTSEGVVKETATVLLSLYSGAGSAMK